MYPLVPAFIAAVFAAAILFGLAGCPAGPKGRPEIGDIGFFINIGALLVFFGIIAVFWYYILRRRGETGSSWTMELLAHEHKDARDTLERLEKLLTIKGRIAHVFLTVPDDDMYSEVLRVVLEVMDSRQGAFGYLDENGSLVLPSLSRDVWHECQVTNKKFVFARTEWGDSTWGRALRERKVNYTNDPSTRIPAGHIDIHRHICMPLVRRGNAIGIIMVANAQRDYVESDLELLGILADDIAPILDARMQRDREHDRRIAEEKDRGMRTFIESALACLPEGFMLTDQEGRFTYVNNAIVSWLDRRPEDFIGKRFHEMNPPLMTREATRTIAEKMRMRLEEGGIAMGVELDLLDRQGRRVPVAYSACEIRDKSGKIAGAVALVADIGRRKRAETRLSHVLAELARSNLELEQFAYVASHDLQEPLRMISSYTNLIAERHGRELGNEGRELMAYAQDGVARMQRLIDDLLLYSRLNTQGKPMLPTDSLAAMREAMGNLQETIRETGAVISHDNLPVVEADSGQLVQVFQNLIGNAIKFRREDTPRVHVSAEAREKEWVFSVKDNGLGIEPEHLERIFMVFQRLHDREKYPGTGIGLALCQRIVARHGGKIWVESKPGEGSSFFFTIRI